MPRIYTHPTQPTVDLPALDLLSFLFDSPHSLAEDSTFLHQDAAIPSNSLTKLQLRSLTERIAYSLRQDFGIGAKGPGKDVVTVISYGQILVPAVFFGIIAAGGVYSAASPSSTPAELRRQVELARSGVLVCGEEHAEVAKQCGLEVGKVLVLSSTSGAWGLKSLDGKADLLKGDGVLQWPRVTDPAILKNSLIAILWSSGTTGLPKGVKLSHTNLVAETYITALSGRAWAAAQTEAGTFTPVEYRTLAHLPTSHIAGLFGYLIAPFYSGGLVLWMRRYRWEDLLKYLRKYEITAFYTVPSIWLRIAKSPEITNEFQHLEGAATGAAPMDGALQSSASSLLREGTAIGQTWGLSETTGAVTAVPRGERDVSGSIGRVLPSVELRVVDEGFEDVQEGQEGELIIRSPLVTNGYFDNEKATKEAFHEDWFCSGDTGVVREGRFYVVDRKKELLKYKGLQVAPAEIENLLFSHPGISEAAVVGIPAPGDPGTDLPRAYVVRSPPYISGSTRLREFEVKAFVKQHLAEYKQLRGGVVFVESLPKNAIGKVLRRELRERARLETGTGRGGGVKL